VYDVDSALSGLEGRLLGSLKESKPENFKNAMDLLVADGGGI